MGTISQGDEFMDGAGQESPDEPELSQARIERALMEADRHTVSLAKVELLRAAAEGASTREAAARLKEVLLQRKEIDKRILISTLARVVPGHLRPMLGVQTSGEPYPPPRRRAPDQPPLRRPSAEPERVSVAAMIRHPKGDRSAWIARCGNAPRGCRGELGRFEASGGDGDPSAPAPRSPQFPIGSWILQSIYGFGGDAESGFRVLGPPSRGARKEKIGRSPLPDRFGNVGGRLDFIGRWRGFVGQVPQPPCSVECPICRTLNLVATPPVD